MQIDKTKKITAAAIAGLSLSVISGCATVVSGTSQTVTIETNPVGASCVLTREGQSIGAINPTPGSVQVGKDKDNIQITCTKEGYWETTGDLAADFQGMTLGNVLIGGVIGVVIDGASGAMHEYPASLKLTMVPTEFASVDERATFFDTWRADVEREAAAATAAAEKLCEGSECQEKRQKIEELKQRKLEDIAKKEADSKVG